MNILRISFSAYNRIENHYGYCIIMIQEELFSISKIYKYSVSFGYYICSEIIVDKLIDKLCVKQNEEFLKAYYTAKKDGLSFTVFTDSGNMNMNLFRFPRFGEADFEIVLNSLGGQKINETHSKTPDFIIDNILLELKDLQKDSLENIERQNNISKIFENIKDYAINIDPSLDFGALTYEYHRLIKNTIKNQFKSASKQIKQYKNQEFVKSGIVIFNTGFNSLPHELFKEMVADILKRETKTIDFAFIFSQRMQTNGWNMDSYYASEWIGIIPNEIRNIKSKFDDLINNKMTEMMTKNNSSTILESQKPISFIIDEKIFFLESWTN